MFSSNKPAHAYQPVSYASSSDESDIEDDFIQRQIKNQRIQMKKQDEGLEMLSESVNRLGVMSLGISEELNNQNMMLDDMENDLDKATADLNIVTRKTRELIKKSGSKRNCMIIFALSIIVVILLFLIIYT